MDLCLDEGAYAILKSTNKVGHSNSTVSCGNVTCITLSGDLIIGSGHRVVKGNLLSSNGCTVDVGILNPCNLHT